MKQHLQQWLLRSLRGWLVTVIAVTAINAHAAVTGATVTPTQKTLYATGNNSVSVRWRLSTDGAASTFTSSPAIIRDPATGGALVTLGNTIVDSGTGPFLINETYNISAADVRSWIELGYNRVILERTFTDTQVFTARAILVLSKSNLSAGRAAATGELSILGLRLEFDTGNNLALAEIDQALTTRLTVSYSGSGLLEGRWLIAEPGSTEAAPLFRTLALLRRNLVSSQRTQLLSPELPTQRAGKYIVRFCVTNRNLSTEDTGDSICPNANLLVEAAYQVQGGADQRVASVLGMAPQQGTVDDATPFSWQPVNGAHIYQLQVFALQVADAGLASSKSAAELVTPQFVVGMVLPAAQVNTPLSELVRSKLTPGQRYLWRVIAHDESGRMIARSAESSFVYQPEP